ncbi:unnamed protein product [Ectocarpus sp. CCAP 1310/34]|nr:unnamed protein product [Ectocarpus sp. CCAP 1310/34]
MMYSSDSFSCSDGMNGGGSVPPFLRAYATRRGYSPIGRRYDDRRVAVVGVRGMFSWKRAVGAAAVFVAFVAAVSTSNSWRLAGGSPRDGQHLQDSGSNSHRGIFEAFEERYSGSSAGGGGGRGEEGPGRLELKATNEYGEYDRGALALYGLEMVVEPHRATRITVSSSRPRRLPPSENSEVSENSENSEKSPSPPLSSSSPRRYYWLLVRADRSGAPLDGVTPLVDTKVAGPLATVTLTDAGEKYALLVQQVEADGSLIAEARVTITCKYVRRELRSLTGEDRTGFFAAMREFYTVSLEEGRDKYGEGFSNAKHVAAYHNSPDYCFHNGMHFLNAHAAFDLWVESNLQKIDPKVSLPQWDYMLEAAHLGTEWPSSEIFSPDMFGSALGSPVNQFQISDGWFSNITSLYDPRGDILTPAESFITTSHNSYGFVDGVYNFQALPGVVRTSSYCGLEVVAEFTKCEVFVDCFESSTTFHVWASCMEHQVHASIHGMIGGGFDCNIDMIEFHEENPQYDQGLLTFTLGYVLANKWPSNSLMRDFNECDEQCDVDQGEPCGCTCLVDPFEWTDDEVYDFMEDVLESLRGRANGASYVGEDVTARHPYGFMQEGERLDEESTMLLLRQMMVIGCQPGKVGAMSTGAAPLDPIFWTLHSGFEKAQHILQLSPGYRDAYDFEWVDADCGDGVAGGKLDDVYPWTEQTLGLGEGSELLTNADLTEILHPSNPKLPYLYEAFGKWGTCTDWDPCPECSDTAALARQRR